MRRRRPVYILESRIPREDMRLRRVRNSEPYGALDFGIDVTLFLLSGGLWGIWIFCRELRGR